MVRTMPATAIASPTISKAGAADVPALAYALARAFDDDPASAWFLPDRSTRLGKLERWFATIALQRLTMPHGEVYQAAGHAGAALWVPPGAPDTSTLALLPAMARVAGLGLPRVLRGVAAMDAVHPHEAHYYLPYVGVVPEHQGRGLGVALLEPMLERADREGVPAYLEASTEASRRLYLRLGFEDCADLRLPDGPRMWPMWRTPS